LLLTDSWLLEELAEKIESAEAQKQKMVRPISQQPAYVTVLARALEEALRVLGRSGSDVIDTLLVQRYGLYEEDIAYRPGAYMSAMKDLLDTGCEVLQRVILEEVRKETGIEAMSVEEVACRLKEGYAGQYGSARQFSFRIEYHRQEQDGRTR
jgi:hypothetical protein